LYFVEIAKTAQLIDDERHQVSALNGFFRNVEEIEPHFRFTDVKGYALQMLQKFANYFGEGSSLAI